VQQHPVAPDNAGPTTLYPNDYIESGGSLSILRRSRQFHRGAKDFPRCSENREGTGGDRRPWIGGHDTDWHGGRNEERRSRGKPVVKIGSQI
jgi:hypothetical protein